MAFQLAVYCESGEKWLFSDSNTNAISKMLALRIVGIPIVYYEMLNTVDRSPLTTTLFFTGDKFVSEYYVLGMWKL